MTTTNRRTRHAVLAAAATAALALTACGGGDDGDGDGDGTSAGGTLTIGLTYVPDVQFAPFYVAEASGYFEEEGVDVVLRHHGASEGLFTAAEAGEEDVVVAGGDEMLQAVDAGADLVTVATLYEEYPVAILVPEDSDIHAPADLAGHTVGVPGEFGQTWFGLQAALTELADPDSVTVETIGFTQVTALTAGHVDAVMGFVNNDAVSLARSGTPVRAVALGEDVPLVGIGLVATGTALEQRAEDVAAVVRAVARATADVAADPAAAVEIAADYVPDLDTDEARDGALAVLTATAELYGADPGTPVLDGPRWAAMAEFMAAAGLLSGEVNTADAIRVLPDTGVTETR